MNNRDEYLMEQYFSRQITPAEQGELQHRITEDAELADQFRFQQLTAAATIKSGRAQLKATLQEAEKKRSDTATSGWSVWSRYSVAAAAAVAILFFAVPYLLKMVNPEPEIAFVAYPNEFATAGPQDAQTTLDSAASAYQAKNYTRAAALFAQVNPQKSVHIFYQGVSLAATQDYTAAIAVLLPLSQNTDDEYAAPALYYLADAYWNTGNKEAAKTAAKAYLATAPKRIEAPLRANAEKILGN